MGRRRGRGRPPLRQPGGLTNTALRAARDILIAQQERARERADAARDQEAQVVAEGVYAEVVNAKRFAPGYPPAIQGPLQYASSGFAQAVARVHGLDEDPGTLYAIGAYLVIGYYEMAQNIDVEKVQALRADLVRSGVIRDEGSQYGSRDGGDGPVSPSPSEGERGPSSEGGPEA